VNGCQNPRKDGAAKKVGMTLARGSAVSCHRPAVRTSAAANNRRPRIETVDAAVAVAIFAAVEIERQVGQALEVLERIETVDAAAAEIKRQGGQGLVATP
jgi:hypothetical protein